MNCDPKLVEVMAFPAASGVLRSVVAEGNRSGDVPDFETGAYGRTKDGRKNCCNCNEKPPKRAVFDHFSPKPKSWKSFISKYFNGIWKEMAERVGFEPTVRGKPYTRFPSALLKPLGHLSGGFGGGGIRTHVPGSSPDNPISSRARYDHFGTPPHSGSPPLQRRWETKSSCGFRVSGRRRSVRRVRKVRPSPTGRTAPARHGRPRQVQGASDHKRGHAAGGERWYSLAVSQCQVSGPVQRSPRTMSGPEGSSIKRTRTCAAGNPRPVPKQPNHLNPMSVPQDFPGDRLP